MLGGECATNIDETAEAHQRYPEEIRAQQNYAGSGEIQEERVDADGHNVFSAYAPCGSSKVLGNET